MRNIALIESSVVLWKILFKRGLLIVDDTEVIFGRKYLNDIDSNIYLYITLQKIRKSMTSGDVCILSKLDEVNDQMYDVLNQKDLKTSNQCFANIRIRGETTRCFQINVEYCEELWLAAKECRQRIWTQNNELQGMTKERSPCELYTSTKLNEYLTRLLIVDMKCANHTSTDNGIISRI